MNAVSKEVEDQLKAKGLTVNRISGNDRYETALKVAEEAIDNGVLKSSKIFLCSGISPADALSIASAAAKEKGIILLTNGNSLTDGVKKYIKSGVKVKIIGGVGVISDKLEQELKSMGAAVERISGKDRYETSVKVYEKYYKPIRNCHARGPNTDQWRNSNAPACSLIETVQGHVYAKRSFARQIRSHLKKTPSNYLYHASA